MSRAAVVTLSRSFRVCLKINVAISAPGAKKVRLNSNQSVPLTWVQWVESGHYLTNKQLWVLHNKLSSLKFLSLTILHTRKNRQCMAFDFDFAPLAAKLAGLVNKKSASFNAHEFSPVEAFFLDDIELFA